MARRGYFFCPFRLPDHLRPARTERSNECLRNVLLSALPAHPSTLFADAVRHRGDCGARRRLQAFGSNRSREESRLLASILWIGRTDSSDCSHRRVRLSSAPELYLAGELSGTGGTHLKLPGHSVGALIWGIFFSVFCAPFALSYAE